MGRPGRGESQIRDCGRPDPRSRRRRDFPLASRRPHVDLEVRLRSDPSHAAPADRGRGPRPIRATRGRARRCRLAALSRCGNRQRRGPRPRGPRRAAVLETLASPWMPEPSTPEPWSRGRRAAGRLGGGNCVSRRGRGSLETATASVLHPGGATLRSLPTSRQPRRTSTGHCSLRCATTRPSARSESTTSRCSTSRAP